MGVRVRVDPANNKRVLLRHPVHAVLSVREGGLVGKGGQNSDEALDQVPMKSRRPTRPPEWAIIGGQPEADKSQARHHRVSFRLGQTPGQTPSFIFTVFGKAR